MLLWRYDFLLSVIQFERTIIYLFVIGRRDVDAGGGTIDSELSPYYKQKYNGNQEK